MEMYTGVGSSVLRTGETLIAQDKSNEHLVGLINFASGALSVHVDEDNLALRYLKDEVKKWKI